MQKGRGSRAFPKKLMAVALSASAHVPTLERISSASRKAEIMALRQKQQQLLEKLADVSKEFDLSLQVPCPTLLLFPDASPTGVVRADV